MKVFIFIAALVVALSNATPPPIPRTERPLLGAKECTWGPSYWCKNLTAAASCHATKHCIQTDWIHRQLPPDGSSICQTCLDMVKQARDQLLSNETQDLIKQVFEGTCSLIHFKPIVEECDKIVDNFIPDLIDTLASEMNPQVVCSVAGLCNNREYLESLKSEPSSPSSTLKPYAPVADVATPCEGCQTVVGVMEEKFAAMSKDEVLHGFLMMCRHTGSLSDACSNIILTYFTEIYEHIKEHLNPGEVCILSGQCSALFHRHDASAGVQITPVSNIGVLPVGVPKKSGDDDLTCEFCEQLVRHLRDILVANTTEEEFKRVMEQLCKQTRSFADECVGLVDEYYPIAYQYLLNELNGTEVCAMVGICPRGAEYEKVPIVPLLPHETADALEKKPALVRVPLTKNTLSINAFQHAPALGELGRPEDSQLPIDLLNPLNSQLFNKQVCEFCQFFLHYVQQALTDPKTEEQIKRVIEKACDELPSSVNETCQNFVTAYEPALVALLAQEIDPSQICPLVRACPSEEVRDVDVFMQQETGDNSKCPLCLFAVQKLEEMVKDNKTEEDIKKALEKVCSKLPKELAGECQEFVDTYIDQLVEMLIADLNPQEVCVYLKLCTDEKPAPAVLKPLQKPVLFSGQVDTNAILDNTYEGVIIDFQPVAEVENVGNVECFVCKKVIGLLMTEVKDITDKQAVLDFFKHVCVIIPDVSNKDCSDFIQKYGDVILNLLMSEVAPSEICSVIQLCGARQLQEAKLEIFDCPVCESAVWAMDKILENPNVDHKIEHVLEKTCRALPSKQQPKCRSLIEKYGPEIFGLIERPMADKKKICRKIGLCGVGTKVMMETDSAKMTVVF